MAGILYGVGVGPGDCELLTLKAVRIMRECDIIATPKTNGENNLALDIVKGAVDIKDKEILELDFVMSRDRHILDERHAELANEIIEKLEQNKNVAMLNLGDVSIYSTFSYIRRAVEARGYATKAVPGVPSFCAVAADLGVSLTKAHKPLHIIPASYKCTEEALALDGSKVLMKTGKSLPAVKEALQMQGLEYKASLVANCGLPDEAIYKSIMDAPDDVGYFATIVVQD